MAALVFKCEVGSQHHLIRHLRSRNNGRLKTVGTVGICSCVNRRNIALVTYCYYCICQTGSCLELDYDARCYVLCVCAIVHDVIGGLATPSCSLVGGRVRCASFIRIKAATGGSYTQAL